jgi:hypothetical protein
MAAGPNRREGESRLDQLVHDTAANERRRVADTRIDTIITDVANLKIEMAMNTAVTTQVRDILTSFRLVAIAAKWIAAIGAGLAALWHGLEFLRR